MLYNRARFLLSVAKLVQLPADSGMEVAVIGRSNAGKSSAINALVGQNRLAYSSKTPGRTQLINFFQLDEDKRLVDLPGYGYAKVALASKENWQDLVHGYLQERACLRGLVLVMDIRHPLQPLDLQLLSWAEASALPLHILLTKADKLSHGLTRETLLKVKGKLNDPNVTIQIFSARKLIGVKELGECLSVWLA